MNLFDSFSSHPVIPSGIRSELDIAYLVCQDDYNLALAVPASGRTDVSPQSGCSVDGQVRNTGNGKKVCKCNLDGCNWYSVPKEGNNTDPAKDGLCPGPAFILGPLVTAVIAYSLKKRFFG